MLRVCLVVLAAFVAAWSAGDARAERRVALVVGNSAYAHATMLANPLNDARDVAAALRATGFEVVEALDADKRRIDAAVKAFAEVLGTAEVALFFYAGHGLQVGLQNYLVPIDARLDKERDLEFEAVKLEFVLRQMEIDREGKITIVLLDACRDNPLARNLARTMGTRSASIGKGLAQTATGLGTFIAYATQPGNVALDGEGARNSPFTTALLKHMRNKGRSLPATMIEVRKDVVAATGGRQVPWDHSALTGDFQFVPGDSATQPTQAASTNDAAEVAAAQPRPKKPEDQSRDSEARAPAAGQGEAFHMRFENRLEGNVSHSFTVTGIDKCLAQCLDNAQCMGFQLSKANLCQHFTRVDRRDSDPNWRSGVRQGALDAAAASAAKPAFPPITARPVPGKESTEFELTENVGMAGELIGSPFRAANPVACREACAKDASCIGFQHGRRVPVMGQCELFSRIDTRNEDSRWRSGVRTGASSGQPVQGQQIGSARQARRDDGLPPWIVATVNEHIDGDQIKTGSGDSIDSCMVACRNTPGCVGATYDAGRAKTPRACTLFRTIRGYRCCSGISARWREK